ncbi:flagellar brake protein [Massilibacterium senegalense]|uniref:flagellar brake protein n=1 Tax=Massilibacterium senegalense TaxID=1632858 RepID=UPI0007839082|nr:flagellar brake domain-containing protein [Massilibacterium senegalense]
MMQVGMPLFLERVDDNDEIITYRSRIVELNDTSIYIDYPINQQTGKVTFLLENTPFTAWYVGVIDQAVYRFFTTVSKRVYKEIPMIELTRPEVKDIERIQRRQFVRVETAVNTACHPIHQPFEPFVTVSEDISGGGMSILVPDTCKWEPDWEVNLYFSIYQKGDQPVYYQQLAKVIRLTEVKELENRKRVSLEFVDIDEKVRQELIRFCFQHQLKMKKKGII